MMGLTNWTTFSAAVHRNASSGVGWSVHRPLAEIDDAIIRVRGEMAEWSKAPDSKSGNGQPFGGSNPSLSATAQNVRTGHIGRLTAVLSEAVSSLSQPQGPPLLPGSGGSGGAPLPFALSMRRLWHAVLDYQPQDSPARRNGARRLIGHVAHFRKRDAVAEARRVVGIVLHDAVTHCG
jgi:hypothetical protein